MVLVVGASGFMGREVAKQLLSKNYQVRALVRTPSKVEDLKQLGAEIVQGDMIDAESLKRACRGVTRVVATAHSLIGNGKYRSEAVDDIGNHTLIDAAKDAGVQHFIFASVSGAGPEHPIDFARTKYAVEEYLKASGMTYTIFRPTFFMEWHAHIFIGKSILETGKTRFLGTGTKLRNYIAVRDVAQFVLLALENPGCENRILEIGGPDNLSNYQVAELYGKAVGITPRISRVPPGAVRLMSFLLKPFNPGLSRVMKLSILQDDADDENFDPAPLLAEFPVRLTTIREFIREQVQ